MLSAYFDDSGQKDKWAVMGGFVAAEDQWAAFTKEWVKALSDAEVQYFHATDFFSCRGEFEGWENPSEKHRTYALRFAEIATRLCKAGEAVSVDWQGFNRQVPQHHFLSIHSHNERITPPMFALRACLENLLMNPYLADSDEPIAVYIEEGGACGDALAYVRFLKRKGHPGFQRFTGLRTVDKNIEPVQAADYLAYEAWRYTRSYSRDRMFVPERTYKLLFESDPDDRERVAHIWYPERVLANGAAMLDTLLTEGDEGTLAQFQGTYPVNVRAERRRRQQERDSSKE